MKRIGTLLFIALVAFAAYALGTERMNSSTVKAASLSTSQGRYEVVALNSGQYAVMVDTQTGKTWYLAFVEYCKSPTGALTMTTYSEGCKDPATALSPWPDFEQFSVEGLYTSPSDPMVQLMRQHGYKVRDVPR